MENKSVKEQLASGYLTHELRAPLASVRFALELFLDKNSARLDEEDRRLMDISLRNISKLNLLITDIMDQSKIQTGRMKMQLAPSDAAQLARETAGDMEAWARRSGIAISVSAQEDCPPAFIDRRRTVQALTNLISNALKFTPAGGRIEISVRADDPQHPGFVTVKVKDTGCGIAQADLRRIFGYFVQVGPMEKRQEGTGLGLSLARSMMEIQGGGMWASCEPGQGSVFTFTLPLRPPPQPAAPEKIE